ncbi:MAG: 2-C-methyl-D-erythritol 2,4-cyclodiphosphate synthase [Bacteroidota bacterium]
MHNFRIGFGYDLHRLVPDRPLMLGGVDIPFELGLKGHSDADALLHAITDALLGALALRDIGHHFPDTDPQYKNADSRLLLRDAYALVREKGWQLGNLDATIIAERPKMNPHIPKMQQHVADDLDCELDQVSLKATTNEGVDAPGRGEAIAVHAVVLLVRL